MAKKYIYIASALMVILGSSTALARLSFDKTPNEAKENSKKADIATINNEQLLKQLLEQSKKTNELLQRLLEKESR